MSHSPNPVRLDPPGAGLPWKEAFFARYLLMPLVPRRTPWEVSNSRFLREGEKVLALLSRFDPTLNSRDAQLLEKPILVPPMSGIEDSSRNWSVVMALEHLMTVGQGMTAIITELKDGHVPDTVVDTAKVKPSQKLRAKDAVAEFTRFLAETHSRVSADEGDKKSKARLNHPWFGPITAHQWNWLLASHQLIHRKQIEQIILRLPHTGG